MISLCEIDLAHHQEMELKAETITENKCFTTQLENELNNLNCELSEHDISHAHVKKQLEAKPAGSCHFNNYDFYIGVQYFSNEEELNQDSNKCNNNIMTIYKGCQDENEEPDYEKFTCEIENAMSSLIVEENTVNNDRERVISEKFCEDYNNCIRGMEHKGTKARYKCTDCSYESSRRNVLKQHLLCRHNKETITYRCTRCTYETKVRDYLVKHYSRVHSEQTKTYECPDCSYESRVRENLSKHYRRNHIEKIELYKCIACPYETKFKSTLTKHHNLKHTEITEVFKCDDCQYKTKIKYNMDRHIANRHTKQSAMFNCTECKYETRYKDHLARHYNCTHRKQTETYKCAVPHCAYQTPVKEYMSKHFNRKHKRQIVNMYKCANCLFETTQKSGLRSHIKCHRRVT